MTACSAINCTNRSEQGFKMKKFPQDPDLRKIYESNAKKITNKENVFFCEVHFDDNQWEEVENGRILKRFAIPTIFSDTSPVPKKRNTMANSHNCDDAVSMPTLKPQAKFVKRTKWSNEENKKLIQLVKLYDKDWKKISQCFTRRTDIQCKQRWQKLLDLRVVKRVRRPWAREEDDKLKELVEKYGTEDWNSIASHLERRIGRQCKNRWTDILNPAAKKREQKSKHSWSMEEQKALYCGYKQWGKQWARIATLIPGRTQNAIKAYWNSDTKKKKTRDNLLRLKSKLDAGPKRRGRPKKKLPIRERLSESSEFSDAESEPKNVQVLLNKCTVDSNDVFPSATDKDIPTNSVLEQNLTENVKDDKRRENTIVHPPSENSNSSSSSVYENMSVENVINKKIVTAPYLVPTKTHNYCSECKCMKHDVHSEDVSSATTAVPEDSVLNPNFSKEKPKSIENVSNKRTKNIEVQSPSKNLNQLPAKTQNPTGQETPVAINSDMDDIIIINVHSLNSQKPPRVKTDEEFLPSPLQENIENEYNSYVLYENPEESVGKNSGDSQQISKSGVLYNEVPLQSSENQLQSPLKETENLLDINTNNQTALVGCFNYQPSCSSTEADCSSSPEDQPRCSLLPSTLDRLSSEHSFEDATVTGTSNFLESTSLPVPVTKKNCRNETPVGLSSESQFFHTPENSSTLSNSTQNDFEKKINGFFNHMQAAKHTYDMICNNVSKEFETIVSEAAASNSSDLGEFSFMKPFLDTRISSFSNTKCLNSMDFLKAFILVDGLKRPSTSNEGQSRDIVQMVRPRGGESHETEASPLMLQSTSEEHHRGFKRKRKTLNTMCKKKSMG